MNETTFTEFVIYGVFPIVFLVGMLKQLEHFAKMYNWSAKKRKIMEAWIGLGGAFIVIMYWTQLVKQAQP